MLEREAMAIVVSARGVFYPARDAALRKAGSALALLANPAAYVRQLGEKGVQAVKEASRDGEKILEGIASFGAHVLLPGEEGYPGRLMQISNPPHLLFVQGCTDLCDALPVAIVGTRGASEYGIRHTREIARDLTRCGACIVSGLALGIDSAAHEGALDAGGRTVAVLGGALDKLYPASNRRLRDAVLDAGGSVISEYPMGVAPTKYSFLHRNRIVAGLSMGVLVTEGPKRSGAQRTASDAADFGREVFALPGSVDAPGSALPHKLIAEGAHLAGCAADVLRVLAPQLANELEAEAAPRKEKSPAEKAPAESRQDAPKEPAPLPANLTEQERAVLAALASGEKEFDELCEETGVDATELGAMLMEMEMDGTIDALPGLRYARRV